MSLNVCKIFENRTDFDSKYDAKRFLLLGSCIGSHQAAMFVYLFLCNKSKQQENTKYLVLYILIQIG